MSKADKAKKPGKRPYEPPRLVHEQTFERAALTACSKAVPAPLPGCGIGPQFNSKS